MNGINLRIHELDAVLCEGTQYILPLYDIKFETFVIFVWASEFLGTFAKLRKATISFIMSVCLSAWNNLAPTGRILTTLDI